MRAGGGAYVLWSLEYRIDGLLHFTELVSRPAPADGYQTRTRPSRSHNRFGSRQRSRDPGSALVPKGV